MGTLEITRGRQALELRSNLSERRALTDPICSSGQDESSARNLQWAKAHGESWPPCPKLASRGGTAQGAERGCKHLLGSSHLEEKLPAQSHQPGDRSTMLAPLLRGDPTATSPVGTAPALSPCRFQPCAPCPLPSPAGEPAPSLRLRCQRPAGLRRRVLQHHDHLHACGGCPQGHHQL